MLSVISQRQVLNVLYTLNFIILSYWRFLLPPILQRKWSNIQCKYYYKFKWRFHLPPILQRKFSTAMGMLPCFLLKLLKGSPCHYPPKKMEQQNTNLTLYFTGGSPCLQSSRDNGAVLKIYTSEPFNTRNLKQNFD